MKEQWRRTKQQEARLAELAALREEADMGADAMADLGECVSELYDALAEIAEMIAGGE